MAFVSLGSKAWGSGPELTFTFSYEKQRSGADMQYRIKVSIAALTGAHYFGYPIYMKTSLAGSLKDTKTLKSASPSQWSSAIEYTTSWFTISNKTTGTVALSLNVYSGSGNSRNYTYSYTLPIDPAASVLGAMYNFTIGNAFTIPITKYNSSFTDTLTVSVANTVVKTVTGITNGYSFNFTSSELNTIYSKLPSATSASFTFTLTTKSGSTSIGSASTKTVTGTIPSSVKPSISSVSVAEVGSVPTDWGIYVKNKSKIKFTISASPGTGSSISNIKTVVNGGTYYGVVPTTSIINVSGDLTATITVTDKRNRTASTTKTISITDYEEPYITTLNAFRCDADGNATDKGNYLYVHLKGGIYSLGGKNTPFSYAVKWKKSSDTDFQTYLFEVTESEIDSYVILPDIESASSYNVKAVISDYFNQNGISKNAQTISSVFRTMNFKPGGHGIGIGKIAEEEDLLDIALQTRLAGGLKQVVLEAGTDLDDVMIPNTYTGLSISGGAGYLNLPVDSGTFTLTVIEAGPDGQRKQIFEKCSKNSFEIWERFYYNSAWGSWITRRGHYLVSASTADLNNYKTAGLYFFRSGTTITNIPGGVNGWLEVVCGDDQAYVKQFWYRLGTMNTNDHDMWMRTYYNGTWSTWAYILTNKSWPVGSVIMTATNTNPSANYGGTWTLIDKELTPASATSGGFTNNTTNITSSSCYWSRGGHSVTFEIAFVNKVAITDTTLTIGTIDLSTLGITRFNNTHRIVGYTDAGNCCVMINVSVAGAVTTLDIIPESSIAADNTILVTFTATIAHTNMVDSACNKFYWKRTA